MTTPILPPRSTARGNQKSYLEVAVRAALGTIHYARGSRTVKTANGHTYLRGIMIVRGIHVDFVTYDTIERMDGTPWLRPSTYRAAMEVSVDPKNPGRHQIRPVHSQRNSEGRICNFLIHASAPPHLLTGCVAPGYESARGLEASNDALETIFRCLGGFQSGKQVFFEVSGTMPAR